MSATLSGSRLIADWLGAKFYVSKYRPVPIDEHLAHENAIYSAANAKQFFRTASQPNSNSSTQKPPAAASTVTKFLHRELENSVTNAVFALAIDTASSGYGVLVFCSSRQGSQATTILISHAMPTEQISTDNLDKRSELIASLQALPSDLKSSFSNVTLCGVAFHHADMSLLNDTEDSLPVAKYHVSWLLRKVSQLRSERRSQKLSIEVYSKLWLPPEVSQLASICRQEEQFSMAPEWVAS